MIKCHIKHIRGNASPRLTYTSETYSTLTSCAHFDNLHPRTPTIELRSSTALLNLDTRLTWYCDANEGYQDISVPTNIELTRKNNKYETKAMNICILTYTHSLICWKSLKEV